MARGQKSHSKLRKALSEAGFSVRCVDYENFRTFFMEYLSSEKNLEAEGERGFTVLPAREGKERVYLIYTKPRDGGS